MEFTRKEKTKIFLALVNEYPKYQREREQIKMFLLDCKRMSSDKSEYFTLTQQTDKLVESINKEERESYRLMKKFSKEMGDNSLLIKNQTKT